MYKIGKKTILGVLLSLICISSSVNAQNSPIPIVQYGKYDRTSLSGQDSLEGVERGGGGSSSRYYGDNKQKILDYIKSFSGELRIIKYDSNYTFIITRIKQDEISYEQPIVPRDIYVIDKNDICVGYCLMSPLYGRNENYFKDPVFNKMRTLTKNPNFIDTISLHPQIKPDFNTYESEHDGYLERYCIMDLRGETILLEAFYPKELEAYMKKVSLKTLEKNFKAYFYEAYNITDLDALAKENATNDEIEITKTK